MQDFLAELNFVFREESIDGILECTFEKSGILAHYDFGGDYQAVANLNKLRNIPGISFRESICNRWGSWYIFTEK